MTLSVLLLLPAVLALGFWQLERAEEKRAYESAYLDRIASAAVVPTGDPLKLADFARLKFSGRFEPDVYFLVDNQTRQGAVGYAVVSSFVADDGNRWLLNRGFIKGTGDRRQLPHVETPEGAVSIIGVLWPEVGLLPVFQKDQWTGDWPKRVQQLDVERMARTLDRGIPREVRLEAGQRGVFSAPVLSMNMPSEKHTGYAVQWFGLGAALLVGYVIFGFRRHDRFDSA
jgi:cytochrome oxidase assembly protein ShyY1